MPSGCCFEPCQSSMARKLPGGQQVVTGVKPGGAVVAVEGMARMAERNTPKVKAVLAIVCGYLCARRAGDTKLRVERI